MGQILGSIAALGSLVSCSCVNPDADPVAQGIVDRVGASLDPLRPDAPNALSDDQKSFLEFYGIEEASEHRMGTFSSGGRVLSGQVLSPD